jgi:alpha/beta superfamily hydrolase
MASVLISGLDSRIEGKYHRDENSKSPVALILHPSPMQSGGVDAKLAHSIFQCFVKKGFSVLRTHINDTHKQTNKLENQANELITAASALDWLHTENPTASSVWVVGFSFGAWVTAQLLMRRPEIEHFVAISLPAHKHDFAFLHPCPTSGLIIHGEQDSIVLAEHVINFVNTVHKQKGVALTCNIVPKADHFFREKLEELNAHISEYIDLKMDTERDVSHNTSDKRKNARHTSINEQKFSCHA